MMSDPTFVPPQPYYEPALLLQKRRQDHRSLRLLGLYIGCAILLFVALQNILTLPLLLPSLREKYTDDGLFRNGMDLLVLIASMLLPFFMLSRPMRSVSGCEDPLPLERPRGGADVLLTVPAGLMFCMAANGITDLLLTAISALGVELSSPELPMPTGVAGVTVTVFRMVVMPALVEELCFRGYVMQHLRRFGDRFAILTAALCFGLLHCNLIQAPFAFIVGLSLGYFVVRTGSLWPAILIHALNNCLSLVFSYLSELLPAQQCTLLFYFIHGMLFGCGAICFLVYLYRSKENARLPRSQAKTLSTGEKLGAFFSAPTMVIAVCVMLYYTSHYIGLT